LLCGTPVTLLARLEAPFPTSATIMAHSSDPEVVMERIRALRAHAWNASA
jgi:hypothetical protein|tara:strand:- start:1004 stop:1153 length:150 start_codon:yes stop_codon:yes gene_type:complete